MPAIPNTGADSPLTSGTVPRGRKVLRVHRKSLPPPSVIDLTSVSGNPDRHVATNPGARFKPQGRRGRFRAPEHGRQVLLGGYAVGGARALRGEGSASSVTVSSASTTTATTISIQWRSLRTTRSMTA